MHRLEAAGFGFAVTRGDQHRFKRASSKILIELALKS
jgi:hypothetical protein